MARCYLALSARPPIQLFTLIFSLAACLSHTRRSAFTTEQLRIAALVRSKGLSCEQRAGRNSPFGLRRKVVLLESSDEEKEKFESFAKPKALARKPWTPSLAPSVQSLVADAAAAMTTASSSLLGVKSVGVDYGLVRTGLAVTVGYNPKPLTILSDLNVTELAAQVVQICASERASQIVLGKPLHKNGTEADQTVLTRRFASVLACAIASRFGLDFPLYLWDERYTSKEAAARVHNVDPGVSVYKQLDADAACIILEHYYKSNGEGAERVFVPEQMREECVRAWEQRQEEEDRVLREMREQRMSSHDARRAMMERARALESEMARNGTLAGGRKRNKNRKSRR